MCRCRLPEHKIVLHVWVRGVEKGATSEQVRSVHGLWKKTGQSIFNMGPEWSEVCTLQ
jgi:hypothetical protein